MKTSPKDFFITLGSFVSLYVSTVSFLIILASIIDIGFATLVDPWEFRSTREGIRVASSILIVSFPLYLWLSTLVRRWIAKSSENKEAWFFKWLTYLTLFVTVVTMAISLITFVYQITEGTVEGATITKIASVFVIAALIFRHYQWEINRTSYTSTRPLVIMLSALVGAVVIAGLLLVTREMFTQFDYENDIEYRKPAPLD